MVSPVRWSSLLASSPKGRDRGVAGSSPAWEYGAVGTGMGFARGREEAEEVEKLVEWVGVNIPELVEGKGAERGGESGREDGSD